MSTRTLFVGREAEVRCIWRALAEGRHVVVSGRHGVGRTALLRHVAALHEREMPFAFADLSAGSGRATRSLFESLTGWVVDEALSYRTIRYRLVHVLGESGEPCGLVLDDVTRLTPVKLRLVADLAQAGRYRIVAIVSWSLPASALLPLRRVLKAPEVVRLGWLRPRDVRQYLEHAARVHGFGWSADEIEARVQGIGGYPPGMVAAVANERNKAGAAC